MTKKIYLDYAAATPTSKKVFKKMKKYFLDEFANAGAIHDLGKKAKQTLEECREITRQILDSANKSEIVFTSGGTESNALAVNGYIQKFSTDNPDKKLDLFTSKLEHPSVIQIFKEYEEKGFVLHYVKVKESGQIDVNDFREKLEKVEGRHCFVSFMYVNNETGVFQPIKEVSRIIKKSEKDVVFHTDACQAPLYLSLNVNSLGVDLMSLCSQKIYGPKGVGCLYIRNGVSIDPIFSGGKQENGMRAGTANIPLVVGFAESLRLAIENRESYIQQMDKLKKQFLDTVLEEGRVELNGDRDLVLPLAINLSFLKTDKSAEQIVLFFNSKGIYVSSKSACMGSFEKNSEVIESMRDDRKNSIRFSLGSKTRRSDIKYLISAINELG